MTLNDLQKAALILFAAREAGDTGSLQAMRGICYAIRNRVRTGWYDGNWLDVIENADESAGNLPWRDADPVRLTVNDRGLQMLARDIDGIFYSGGDDEVAAAIDNALYWQRIDKPIRQWFVDNIVRRPEDHGRRAQISSIVFFD